MTCLDIGFFVKIGKKPTFNPIHKKNGKQSIKTIDQFRFFQYVWKSLRGLLCNKSFFFSLKTTWYLKINLDLKPGDSCINQLLSITYQIQSDLWVLWWWVESKRCFPWHIKSVWQSLRLRCDIKTKTKWNVSKFTKDQWRLSVK